MRYCRKVMYWTGTHPAPRLSPHKPETAMFFHVKVHAYWRSCQLHSTASEQVHIHREQCKRIWRQRFPKPLAFISGSDQLLFFLHLLRAGTNIVDKTTADDVQMCGPPARDVGDRQPCWSGVGVHNWATSISIPVHTSEKGTPSCGI